MSPGDLTRFQGGAGFLTCCRFQVLGQREVDVVQDDLQLLIGERLSIADQLYCVFHYSGSLVPTHFWELRAHGNMRGNLLGPAERGDFEFIHSDLD